MSNLLTIFLLLSLAAVVGVMLLGVYSMGRGGESNRKYSNVLMRWRIVLQVAAVGIMVLLFYVNQS